MANIITSFSLSAICIMVWFAQTAHCMSGVFKVGVVNQVQVQGFNAVTRQQALKTIYGNLAVMDVQAQNASKQGVKVIVYPEYGITGWIDGSGKMWTRKSVYPFLEHVPEPGNGSCSLDCSEQPASGREAQTAVACLAKTYGMYVSANLIEGHPCARIADPRCPNDSLYMYNTNIIFNPSGCLIAKYHKYHLVDEEPLRLNAPQAAEHVYFDTEYGRFGTVICADGMYTKPTADLVEKYKIDHLIYPMAWANRNAYVYMMSTQWQYALAARFGVNVLSANVHNVSDYYEGSGIFHSQNVSNFIFNYRSQTTTLVTADIPIGKLTKSRRVEHATKGLRQFQHRQAIRLRKATPAPDGQVNIYGDTYMARVLQGNSNSTSVCYEDHCCSLTFTRNNSSEFYILAAYRGNHTYEETVSLENCIVYKCPVNSLNSCGARQNSSETVFSSLQLSASFTTEYVFPSVLPSGFAYQKFKWTFERPNFLQNIITSMSKWPLVEASLIGLKM